MSTSSTLPNQLLAAPIASATKLEPSLSKTDESGALDITVHLQGIPDVLNALAGLVTAFQGLVTTTAPLFTRRRTHSCSVISRTE